MIGPGMARAPGQGRHRWKALSGFGRSQNETVAADHQANPCHSHGPNASRSRCRGSVSESRFGKHASWIRTARELYAKHHTDQSMRHEPCGVNHVE